MTAFRMACVLVSLAALACQQPANGGPSTTSGGAAIPAQPAPSGAQPVSLAPSGAQPAPLAPSAPPLGEAPAAVLPRPEADVFSLDWARANRPRNGNFFQTASRLEEEGHRLYKQHKDAEAVAVYQRALLLYASSSTYYKFGNSLSNVDRLEDAVKAYDIALGLGHFQPELVHYNRACAYSRLKQADAAHAALTQAFDAGYAALEKLNTDPDLAFLRAQPDWQARIEKFRPTPAELRGQFTEYGDRDYQESFALCPDRRVFQQVSEGLDGSCCGSTRQGQLGRRGDQLLVTWSRECGLRGVGGPKRKTEPEETCTPYVGCTQVAECRPRSGEKHLAKMTELPAITREPPGKPDEATDLVYVPFPQDLPAVCTRPSL